MAKARSKAPPVPPASQPSLPASDRLLTEVEAAEYLNCTPRCLQAWRQRGGGPSYVKMKSMVRYRPVGLAAFLDANMRSHTSDPGPAG